MRATIGYNPSYTWITILQVGYEVIDKAKLWRAGEIVVLFTYGGGLLAPYSTWLQSMDSQTSHNNISFVSKLIDQDTIRWNV